MALRHARLVALDVPLHVPFVTALRRVEFCRDVVLRLEDDAGRVGWGSAPPTLPLTGETTAGLFAFLSEVGVPFLAGCSRAGDFSFGSDFAVSRERIEYASRALAKLVAHNSGARGAMETALLDLAARAAGRPLFRCLADAPGVTAFAPTPASAPALLTDVTLSIGDPTTMAKRLDVLARYGFTAFKTKLAGEPDLDMERLRALASRCELLANDGVHVVLRLDANEAFSPDAAIAFFSRASELLGTRLECVEQPVPRNDIGGLARVSKALEVPVFADEAAMTFDDVARLIDADACAGVVVKLAKAGGPLGAKRWMEACLDAGKRVLASCMLECHASLGAMAAVTAAVLLERSTARHNVFLDLDGATLLRRSPFEGGLCYDGARLLLSEAPGSGIVGFSSPTKRRNLEGLPSDRAFPLR